MKSGAGATLAVVQLDHGEAKPYHVVAPPLTT
jgi:hypothetical protein